MFCANAANCTKRLALPEGTDLDDLSREFEEIVRDNAGDDRRREADWLRRTFEAWAGKPAPTPGQGLRERVFYLWVVRAVCPRVAAPVTA